MTEETDSENNETCLLPSESQPRKILSSTFFFVLSEKLQRTVKKCLVPIVQFIRFTAPKTGIVAGSMY